MLFHATMMQFNIERCLLSSKATKYLIQDHRVDLPCSARRGTLRKEAVVGVSCWELEFRIFKTLVITTFIYGTKIWEGGLKKCHWKVLKKDLKIHMMYDVKVCSLTSYHTIFYWPNSEFYALKLAKYGACPPTLLLVNYSSNLTFLAPCWIRFDALHKLTTMRKAWRELSHWDTHDNPTS